MSSTDKIGIALVSDEVIPVCAELLSKNFGHDAPFVDIYFPDHDTPSGQASLSKRLTSWKPSSPQSTFLKAVTKPGQSSHQAWPGQSGTHRGLRSLDLDERASTCRA
ncbi:uncharacterized protein BDR25DRAFT_319567 [Lindgomyces ingoldianus]|uniref:Uncharacterized protein n=1 Tax=Lindgomyces ingoldianus TaxID=673940 RepID=A0ACB6QAH9_9PLEO|nr:uncharacterized protein BDR25DRAFT_319567 [Lindgomyces ingoldianus]KAF2463969.1 hypothetical protein BDR25DRAFT_319567 [Lindgomyces ingoldianus]